MNEQQLMLNFKKDHLSNAELGKIAQLTKGIFDVEIMTKLLTKIGASLAYYEPDAMVKSYLYQHSHSLGWERDKLHFRNPKEKDSRTKGDSKGPKRKPSSDARDSRHKRQKLDTPKIRSRDQCQRKSRRQKGTYLNHAHKDCRINDNKRLDHKEKDLKPVFETKRRKDARHPNLEQAPPKKTRNPKSGASTANDTKTETRTCYICNKPGHIAPNCPEKAANKQNAQAKLFKNKNFMVLWQETWDDHDEQVCATRVVNSWGDDNLCPLCHQAFTLDHRCNPEDKCVSSKFDGIKAKLRQTKPASENDTRSARGRRQSIILYRQRNSIHHG
jgi:hypothetical protein